MHDKNGIVLQTIWKPGVLKAISDVCELGLGALCTWPVQTCSSYVQIYSCNMMSIFVSS